jgi:hypothetical protein
MHSLPMLIYPDEMSSQVKFVLIRIGITSSKLDQRKEYFEKNFEIATAEKLPTSITRDTF